MCRSRLTLFFCGMRRRLRCWVRLGARRSMHLPAYLLVRLVWLRWRDRAPEMRGDRSCFFGVETHVMSSWVLRFRIRAATGQGTECCVLLFGPLTTRRSPTWNTNPRVFATTSLCVCCIAVVFVCCPPSHYEHRGARRCVASRLTPVNTTKSLQDAS